ncbi:MAG: hypothetical protein ACRC6V_04550, partial [Bacteroidales bacterium]
MAEYDRGRLNLPQLFDTGPGVQNPFRGVFEEGIRQTGVDAAEGLTESRMREEGLMGERPWNTPIAGMEGGALSQTFGNYKMTPESPSLSESMTWDYQPKAGDVMADNSVVAEDVNPLENPAAAVGAATYRQQGVVSNVRPQIKPPPSQNQAMTEQINQQGQQEMSQKWTKQPWDQNKGMNMAMISFGLNLLSG